MRKFGMVLAVWAGLFVSLNLLFNATSTLAFTSDELSVIAAVEQTTPTPAADIPAEGTFYSAQNLDGPPLPGTLGFACWNLGSGVWLVDDIAPVSTSATRTSAKSMSMMSDDDLNPGDGGTNDGSGYTNSFVPFVIDTNLLWLEVTNYDGNFAYLNLHNGTDYVYCVKSTMDLTVPASQWQVEQEFFPTGDQTNCLPFTVAALNRTNLFLKAEDWTGVTENGNTIPDWWFYLYYGTTALSDTNQDANGNTLLSDYQNSEVPTVFSFTGLEVTNSYVNSMSAPVQLDVSGSPYYIAVSVDDTNYAADANWQDYAGSNVMANLGMTEGWHDFWVGLRGHGDDPSAAVWQWTRLKLDYTPPALIITGPTNGTVSVPLIQLTGYSPEALAGISYDLSNDAGTMTNQQVLVEGEDYDTNTFEFTTNYFQAYDVPLTNGLNVITVHAMDLAGNMTTLTTNIICTGNTNPPAVSLIWPLDGMSISGSNITIEGQVDDDTATVSVSTVDAGGNTNSFTGLTGRDGVFWAENVPLNAGTNTLAITLSNAAGSTTTNISLVQTGADLTVNPVAAGDTMVYGTIGTSNYTIWVNGVQATNSGDGTWNAQITPLCVGGGLVAVAAIPDSDNGGSGSGGGAGVNPQSAQSLNTQATVQPPQGVFVSAHHETDDYHGFVDDFNYLPYRVYSEMGWGNGQGGMASSYDEYQDIPLNQDLIVEEYQTSWPETSWPQILPYGTYIWYDYEGSHTNDDASLGLPQEHRDTLTDYPVDHTGETDPNPTDPTERQTADTEMRLATGGPLGSRQTNLWCISASATDASTGQMIDYTNISIGGLGNLDTNGNLWVELPDNDPPVVTPMADKNNYSFTVDGTKYTLKHQTYNPALTDTNRSRTTLGVGEEVSLSFSPAMPYAMDWTTTAGSVSPTFYPSTTLTAPSNATPTVTVTATFRGGRSVTFPSFTVVEPTGIDHAKIVGTNSFPLGSVGAGMTNDFWIAPTLVSFYRVNIMEIGEDGTNIWGFYSQWTPQQLHHSTADHWSGLNANNQTYDYASFAPAGLTNWAAGGYEWEIPMRWQVKGTDFTNVMAGCNQVFTIDSSGTARVDKYGNWIQRTTNNIITSK
jgi:hypothetical protein